jgi:hypothetical protein
MSTRRSGAMQGMVLAAILICARIAAPQAPEVPYNIVPFEEDWSYLKNPALRSDWLDSIKYIRVGSGENQYLSIGGEFRGAYERVQNDNWSTLPYPLNSFGLERYLLHLDAHLYPQFRIFIELESGLEQGRPGGPRPIDEKLLDFLNAFAEFRPTKSAHSPTFRVGKQELQFGAGRLVSVREGPNVRQGFFGFRVDQTFAQWHTSGFAVRPAADNKGFFDDEPVSSTGFWGVVSDREWKRFEHFEFNGYYYGLDRKEATYNKGTAHEVRQTFGGRFAADPPKDTGDRAVVPHWDLEAIFQAGSFGAGEIRAWGLSTETGLLFPRIPFSPRLGLRADASSGDTDSNSPNLGTFNSLFPIGNYFGVLADTGPGPVNFRDLHPKLILALAQTVTLTPDWVFWWRQSLEDGVYNVPGNLLVAAGSSDARFVGHRPGVEARWQVDRHAYVQGDYGVFFAGPFLRQSGNERNLNYLSFWVGYKF